MAELCRRLFQLTGDEESENILHAILNKVSPIATKAPTSFGFLLRTGHLHGKGPSHLILGGSKEEGETFLEAIQGRLLPATAVASASTPGLSSNLAEGKKAGRAYLCHDYQCKTPVENAQDLEKLLD